MKNTIDEAVDEQRGIQYSFIHFFQSLRALAHASASFSLSN